MLESVSERLMQTVHAGSPTKHPARRLETIRAAGELRIPFTSGILVGIGETAEERIASLEALAAVHAEYGHIQEVILQNFVPHQSYYGQEPAEIADAAAREYWRTGVERDAGGEVATRGHGDGLHDDEQGTGAEGGSTHAAGSGLPARPSLPLPKWATRGRRAGVDRGHEAADRRNAPVDARRGHPDPAEPRRLVERAGGGRRDRPRRPVGQRRPHLPRAPVPLAPPGAQAPAGRRLRADRAAVRVPAIHRSPSGSPRACSTRSSSSTGASSRGVAPELGEPHRSACPDPPRACRAARSRRAATAWR